MGIIERKKSILLNEPHLATASGSIATFDTDMRGKLKECKINFLPVQSGSGNPSPSNVRPISGRTGISINNNGDTISFSWQSEAGTLYGGHVDLVNGELVAEYGYIDLGSITWDTISTANRARSLLLSDEIEKPVDMYTVPNVICEKYAPIQQYSSLSNNKTRIVVSTAGVLILYYDGENLPSGAMAYKLATPISYQLTPQIIKTLIGRNNIWSDAGDVEVQYWKH